jgi:hypothetical protein
MKRGEKFPGIGRESLNLHFAGTVAAAAGVAIVMFFSSFCGRGKG